MALRIFSYVIFIIPRDIKLNQRPRKWGNPKRPVYRKLVLSECNPVITRGLLTLRTTLVLKTEAELWSSITLSDEASMLLVIVSVEDKPFGDSWCSNDD
ncbi:hypothetical protein vseg_019623 [Gypsophila vaccaria]